MQHLKDANFHQNPKPQTLPVTGLPEANGDDAHVEGEVVGGEAADCLVSPVVVTFDDGCVFVGVGVGGGE